MRATTENRMEHHSSFHLKNSHAGNNTHKKNINKKNSKEFYGCQVRNFHFLFDLILQNTKYTLICDNLLWSCRHEIA